MGLNCEEKSLVITTLDGVSDHQPHNCLLNLLFRRRSKKTSKLCVTGLCAGNSPGTGEFPERKASNAENVSIWWRHHVKWSPSDRPTKDNSIEFNIWLKHICFISSLPSSITKEFCAFYNSADVLGWSTFLESAPCFCRSQQRDRIIFYDGRKGPFHKWFMAS